MLYLSAGSNYRLALEPLSVWPLLFDSSSSSPNLLCILIATSMRRELANHNNTCLVSRNVLLSGLYMVRETSETLPEFVLIE